MSIVMSVNAGSSSLKFQVFKMPEEEVLAQGNVERIGLNDSIFGMKANGEKIEEILDIKDHAVAVKKLMEALIEHKVVNSLEDIKAIGHRVVHGGEYFSHSVPVDADVEAKVEELCALAPLHNPAALVGYRSFRDALPECKHTFVFDTAFHQSMPEENYIFPLPYEYYTNDKVRRYGAHGTSHEYLTKRLAELQGKTQEEMNIITCHLGNGASVSASIGGKCVDTSMGLTPLEGLMMGTRSGDIDAGAVTFIMDKEGLTTTGVSNLLNKKSGVLGISGVSSDMRELEAAVAEGNPKAILAENMYFYRIKKYIGAYAAALGGVDVILFTGGVGENQASCRAGVCEGLEFMGVKIDAEKNKVRGEEAIISSDDSKVKVVVIPTDEELLIASDTMTVVSK